MTIDIARVLDGDDTAIGDFARAGLEPWIVLVEHVLDHPAPAPRFASALWRVAPDISGWTRHVEAALGSTDKVTFVAHGKKIVLPWLRDSVLAAFPESHEAVLDLRIADLQSVGRADGGFEEATQLYDELAARGVDAKRRARVAMLAAKGAFSVRDYEAAQRYAQDAIAAFEADEDDTGRNLAERYLAGALAHLGQWNEALALFEVALKRKGPMFGGGGVTVHTPTDDPVERAVGELTTVGRWASATTAEWVRALGAVAEVMRDESAQRELQRKFERALARVAELPKSLDTFEVVIRQLQERSHDRAALVAAKRAADANAGDSWINSVCGNLERKLGHHEEAFTHYRRAAELIEAAGGPNAATAWAMAADAAASSHDFATADDAFGRARRLATEGTVDEVAYYEARSFRARDPEQARDRARALFDRLRVDSKALVESRVGFATTDLLIELLLARGDREALAVQQALVDAKRALWGDAPAVWLERHNLGTIHARLGDVEQARELFIDALSKLRQKLGDGDPHVELCKRSLAKLDGDTRQP